jgi:hypothetical protein
VTAAALEFFFLLNKGVFDPPQSWSRLREQPSRFARKQPNLKLSAHIFSLLFADKLFVICILKDG